MAAPVIPSSKKLLSELPKDQRLAVARLVATRAMPYFTNGIRGLIPYEAPSLGTMGITAASQLLVDYDHLGELTPEEGGATVMHEYMHQFLSHPERFRKLVEAGVLDATQEDHDLFNDAGDAEINHGLLEAGMAVGSDWVTPQSLGLQPNRTAEEYAAQLKERQRKNKNPPKPRTGSGMGKAPCGSGSGGNPLPGEPDPSTGRTPVEQKIQNAQDADAVNAHGRNAGMGTIPGCVARMAAEYVKPVTISWEQRLSARARDAVAFVQGGGDEDWAARSRQQAAMDTIFGDEDAPILPGEIDPSVNVMLAIDSSGSIGPDQLAKVGAHATKILQAIPDARLDVVVCDAEIQAVGSINDAAQLKELLKGGGGTDFRPVFEYIKRFPRKPDVLVFATDGYGTWPQTPPPGIKVIWLIVDGRNSCPWGEVVEHKDEEDAECES